MVLHNSRNPKTFQPIQSSSLDQTERKSRMTLKMESLDFTQLFQMQSQLLRQQEEVLKNCSSSSKTLDFISFQMQIQDQKFNLKEKEHNELRRNYEKQMRELGEFKLKLAES